MYIGSPKILAQSKNGDVYFVSNKDHSVLKVQFGPSSEISNVTRIAGTGYPGKGADDMMATESDLQYPYSVTLIENDQDELTHIIITDTRNHRVRKMDMVTGKIFTKPRQPSSIVQSLRTMTIERVMCTLQTRETIGSGKWHPMAS